MEQGDANAKVLRVRALLKRGGKTPVYNTIVRTENVVATSDDLKGLALATEESHRQLAELYDNRDQKGVVHAIGAVRVSVGQSYGLAKEGRSVPCVDAPAPTGSWPPAYAVTPCGNMAVHGTRLAALCKSFATKHRLETNAENDVGHAICDTVSHLQESYEELDDEVFRNGEHDAQMEIAARLMNRRARQLAGRAKIDAHGEVFASIEFQAVSMSLMRASAHFNALHLGHPLYTGIDVHSELPPFNSGMVAAESHLLLAESLKHAGMQESAITNTLARASRHAEMAEAIMEVEDAKDPLDDPVVNTVTGQPLRLGEWAAEAMRTGVAQFDVLGGFSMSLSGELEVHTESLANSEWLCLRARTTSPVSGPANPNEVARVAATAAWRRMRYDAGAYDAPYFRPSEEQLRAASRIGIALCGRGNLTNDWWHDADLLVVDTGIAPERLGLVVVGNHAPAHATMHSAQDAVGYMFSTQELELAHDSVDAVPRPGQRAFLVEAVEANPAAWQPSESREESLPDEATQVVSAPLESVPETTITAHEAFERVITKSLTLLVVEAAPSKAGPSSMPDASTASTALAAALCATIRESPRALDDLALRITARAQPSYVAALPSHAAAGTALAPSVSLYCMLEHKGERAVDVAASILGLRNLEPVIADLEPEESEAIDEAFEDAVIDSVDVGAPVESGTPSSEEFDELV